MKGKRSKSVSIVAALIIASGILTIIKSLPLYSLNLVIKRGGIIVEDKVRIIKVLPNSPAEIQLKNGDVIISVNGQNINKSSDFINITNANQGKDIAITIERKGIVKTVHLIPRVNPKPGEGRIGILLTDSKIEKKPLYILIPKVIIRGYSGYEERPSLPFLTFTYAYKNKNLSRLKALFSGLFLLLIGIGLWKLKKIAVYGFIFLVIFNVIINMSYILNPSNYDINIYQRIILNKVSVIDMIALLGGITLDIVFIILIYKQRKLFK